MPSFWKTLPKPISILAPMADVTDAAFRKIITEIAKPDVLFTEFVSVEALASKGTKRAQQRLQFTKEEHPIVAQVWGITPKDFATAAMLIEKLGFDGIDINMGCPDKNVLKRGAGAALLNNHKLVKKIVKNIKSVTPDLPLSIKTRIAYMPDLTKMWIEFLLSLEIDAIILHGRTVKDLSKVDANWLEIEEAVKLRDQLNPDILIIGNGDVKNLEEIKEKHFNHGVDGVMVGRGIFQNPWLFDGSTEHSTQEYLDLLKRHTELFHKTWGDTKNFEIMKKFFKVYVREFEGASEMRQKLMTSKSYEDFLNAMETLN